MRTIEALQVETTLRLALPQTQVVCGLGVVSGDHGVVRHRDDFLASLPDRLHAVDALCMTVETDLVRDIRTLDLPRIVLLEPRVGRLKLAAVGRDQLLEDTWTETRASVASLGPVSQSR